MSFLLSEVVRVQICFDDEVMFQCIEINICCYCWSDDNNWIGCRISRFKILWGLVM